ncbi:MAG: hypothetical protein PHH67_00525 [Methanosarcina sp.]|nr:hypothetical protein [Methanosarcina sp.]MDD3318063.1 hypothetical protein [Methanosarcina sp.]MDD4304991.1 hypothetical protein [Methanosarcina sp.]MDD4619533.1 hypothetical protein [Methanosarcina sp.]NLN43937.1 hypothetical protein [Methanosarcina sp.]
MNTEKKKNLVRKFNAHIEMNKDKQAYSDFKEGVNKGLDIAKYTFEDNLEKISLSDLDEDQDERIKGLENNFNQVLDGIALSKKPNFSEQHLDGVYTGFEKSKKIFKDFLKESLTLENT